MFSVIQYSHINYNVTAPHGRPSVKTLLQILFIGLFITTVAYVVLSPTVLVSLLAGSDYILGVSTHYCLCSGSSYSPRLVDLSLGSDYILLHIRLLDL